MKANLVVLPGDGVGPEVINAALSVLATVCEADGAEVSIDVHLIGGRAIDEFGVPLPDETLDACKAADAVLLGAVGGPAWDHLRGEQRCEAGLLKLRREMDVFANLRPVKVHPHLVDRTTIRPEVVHGTDLVIVRDLRVARISASRVAARAAARMRSRATASCTARREIAIR